jgi:hypothetical protein
MKTEFTFWITAAVLLVMLAYICGLLPIWSACPMPAEPCRAFNLFCDCGLVGVLS